MKTPNEKLHEISRKIGSNSQLLEHITVELRALAKENDGLTAKFQEAVTNNHDARPILARIQATCVRRIALLNQAAECNKSEAALWQGMADAVAELNAEYTTLYKICNPSS